MQIYYEDALLLQASEKTMERIITCYPSAVSYTHLDVYKRQMKDKTTILNTNTRVNNDTFILIRANHKHYFNSIALTNKHNTSYISFLITYERKS